MTLERHFCLMFSCWLNIAGILKKKEKRKKELFLKSPYYLFDRRILRFCYIFNWVSIPVTRLLPPSGTWGAYLRSGYSDLLISIDCISCFYVKFTHTKPLSRYYVRCHHPLFPEGKFFISFNFWGVPMGSIPKGWDALRWFGEVVYLVMRSFSRWHVI